MSELPLQVDESLALERLGSDDVPATLAIDSLQRDPLHPAPTRTDSAASVAKRGDAHRLRGDYAAAISDYTTALTLDASAPGVHVNRGLAYWLSGQAQPAVNDFASALTHDPGNLTALNGRGNALAATGQPDLAIADYTEALRRVPSS